MAETRLLSLTKDLLDFHLVSDHGQAEAKLLSLTHQSSILPNVSPKYGEPIDYEEITFKHVKQIKFMNNITLHSFH